MISSSILSFYQVLPPFSDGVLSKLYHYYSFPIVFNRSIVPLCSSSFRLIKPCISFQPECCLRFFLTPCSIHSIVPEAVCCDFIKYLLILPSSYSIPFIFNRSAARSCSPLFLFSNGVFSASSFPLYSFLEMA